MKIQKKKLRWGSGQGVRSDVNEELKFFVKIQKKRKNIWGSGAERGSSGKM